jgi:hypothetical protein
MLAEVSPGVPRVIRSIDVPSSPPSQRCVSRSTTADTLSRASARPSFNTPALKRRIGELVGRSAMVLVTYDSPHKTRFDGVDESGVSADIFAVSL